MRPPPALSSRARPGPAALIAAIVLSLGLLAPPLQAQAPTGDARAAARALAEKGYALYDAHRYADALALLQQAEATYHAPTLVFAMGKSQLGLGHLVEARALFQRVVAEPLTDTASPAFHEAQRSARDELAALEKRIPTLQIVVLGGGGRALRVTVDDAELSPAQLDTELPQNPGSHRVAVIPADGADQRRAVDLPEGAHQRVVFDLSASGAESGTGEAAADPRRRRWLAPALVGFGVGAVGLAVGIPTGVSAANSSATLKGRCPEGLCPVSDADTLASGRRAALVSTVGFVAAAVGLGAGVTLIVLRPGTTPAKAVVLLGPGSIGLEGAF